MISFVEWLRSFRWLRERNLPCVVSADLDGLACALLQSKRLGWNMVGTYDGESLCLFECPQTVDWKTAVFVDVEIMRSDVRSIGNHLFALDEDDNKRLRQKLPNCANPNLWRGINVEKSFKRKYPFGTLPLLLAAAADQDERFSFGSPWIALILHTDSSFTNAAIYQANALEWLETMGGGDDSPGIARLCNCLRRVSAQQALYLMNQVQQWVGEAGFGRLQRPCRFKPFVDPNREKALALAERIAAESGVEMALPIGKAPVVHETFGTMNLPLNSKRRRRCAFKKAQARRALSMAATTVSHNDKGLSLTLPNADCVVPLLR